MFRLSFIFAVFSGLPSTSVASSLQPNSCSEISVLAKMAQSRSSVALNHNKAMATENYWIQLVYSSRFFALHPRDHEAAIALLNHIPDDDAQQKVVLTLGDSLCDEESVADMRTLGRLRDRLATQWASAVARQPDRLPKYIAYSLVATQDPHSDYAIQMQSVCRSNHKSFANAVKKIPIESQSQLVNRVFNPESCRAIALPEE